MKTSECIKIGGGTKSRPSVKSGWGDGISEEGVMGIEHDNDVTNP